MQAQRGKKSDRWKVAESRVLVKKVFEFYDIISSERKDTNTLEQKRWE